jgi:DNA-binding CsgD family transcriptional regulator
LCTRALEAGEVSPATHARLLALRAALDAELGRMEAADSGSRRALALAERTSDPLAVLDAVLARANCVVDPGEVEERVRLGRLAVRTGESVGRPLTAVLGHGWCADAAYQNGTMAAVDDEIAAVQRLAERTRLPLARWHLLRMRASRLALTGRFESAREASREAYDLGLRMQDTSASGMSFAFALMLGQLRGDPGEMLPGWERMMREAPPFPLRRAALASGLLLVGRRDEAAAIYAEMRELPRTELPDPIRAAGMLVTLAPLIEAFADAEAAGWVHEQLLPWAHTSGVPGSSVVYSEGSMDAELGRMDAVAGRWGEAAGHFREAVAANTRLGARPALVHSWLGLAGALLRRAGPDDVEEAVPLARAAAAEARRLDMPGPLATAGRLLTELAAAARERDPLTERERDVANLVAQGLSNRQIATRLVLSERTVESHVRNILGKLGFASRAEIIAWAHGSRAAR